MCLALAAALIAAPGASAAKPKPGRYVLRLPDPGHVTLSAVEVTARGLYKHRRAPKNIELRALGTRSLPASIRVLYARRRIRGKRANRYELLFLAVNKAGGAASGSSLRARAAGQDDVELMDVLVAFLGGKVPPAKQDDLFSLRWTEAGDPSPVFDKTLDTGHYDDGHSFGWNIKTPAQERRTIEQVVLDAVTDPSVMLQNLEQRAGVDLDGNGTVGPQINTVVGPPVVF